MAARATLRSGPRDMLTAFVSRVAAPPAQCIINSTAMPAGAMENMPKGVRRNRARMDAGCIQV